MAFAKCAPSAWSETTHNRPTVVNKKRVIKALFTIRAEVADRFGFVCGVTRVRKESIWVTFGAQGVVEEFNIESLDEFIAHAQS